MKKIILITLIFLSGKTLLAQDCSLVLKVIAEDVQTGRKLSASTVSIDSGKYTILTNNEGTAIRGNLCKGDHLLKVSFTGYDAGSSVINLESDTVIILKLNKAAATLQSVTIVGTTQKKDAIASLTTSDISGLQLLRTRGNTLAESLKSIPGLNSLQTGPGLSKPVIHGLHGNRVLILNNGIKQEGQQWGSEHAPEIDPFVASKITIIKGAASVRYGSDAIVGVILLEPETLNPAKSFAGTLDLVAASNGRMGVASSSLQGKIKKIDGLSWRLQGTLKEAGNFRTPHYYLQNSGLQEKDASVTLNYKKDRYGAELYYSKFYNKVGIFSGTHVGNVTDLYASFARKIPLTPSIFSYHIDRTYQIINHDLFKVNAFYKFKNNDQLLGVFSGQKNLRDEYDIDLPYTTDPEILKKPQISFKIHTEAAELIYEFHTHNNFSGSAGINGSTQGNVFNGIRYLIPNFRNYTGGAFALEKYSKNNLTLEAGIRYDYRWLRVYQLNNNSLQTYHTTTTYTNTSGTVGATYRINNNFSINANAGSGWRAPSINELYIDGIHLSAASYEKGDSTLKSERSYDFTVSAKFQSDKFSAEAVLYDNVINNFIYARPSLQPIQLISGTYPYFKYTQANVNLKGFDLDLSYTLMKSVDIISKTSLLRGWNKSIKDYLIFLPADKFDNTFKYTIASKGKIKNIYASIQNVSVLRQTRVPPNSDYVAPPKGYSLFNFGFGFTTHISKKEFSVNASINNFTNTVYRDYLNRFRYYSDDLGINAVIRTKINF